MNLFPNGKRLRLKTWRNNYVMMVGNGSHVKQGGAGKLPQTYLRPETRNLKKNMTEQICIKQSPQNLFFQKKT